MSGRKERRILTLSEQLRAFIQERIAAINAGAPGWLSEDGSALGVDGGPTYSCCISPQGDAFIESLDENLSTQVDRSRRAQIETVVLGSRNHPILAELVPQRPLDADTCGACSGKGFVSFEHGSTKTEPVFLCEQCSGLGWISASVFQESPSLGSPLT